MLQCMAVFEAFKCMVGVRIHNSQLYIQQERYLTILINIMNSDYNLNAVNQTALI